VSGAIAINIAIAMATQTAPEPKPAVDASDYYGYLYEANKTPTKVLDALLRAIALYIVSCAQSSLVCCPRAERDRPLTTTRLVRHGRSRTSATSETRP
jgi:hypothetical protein